MTVPVCVKPGGNFEERPDALGSYTLFELARRKGLA